jgi:hypothetical protein
MASKNRLIAGAALSALALTAFFTGRVMEAGALAEKIRANLRASALASSPPATVPPPLTHQQLAVGEILALPFEDFYEALRSAPGDARQKWATELAAMPEGPRRRAAVSGFYKLLVQFDPAAAAKAISEIEDEGLLRLALGAAVNAAPGFALPLMAELSLSLQDRVHGKRDYLSDVMLDWARIDPPATARFLDDHPEAFDSLSHTGRFYTTGQIVSTWAAIDPIAAREWIDRSEKWDISTESFIEGWYESDRAAAISYTLAHAEERQMTGALGAILRELYSDSRDEAKKFIESLPESRRPDAFKEAFRTLILLRFPDSGEAEWDPHAIASWMIEFPPAYWEGVLGGLFDYSENGPVDMLPWIEQLPPEIREHAVAEYPGPSDKSPSEKLMTIFRLADPVLRDQLLKGMLNSLRLDFDEAATAVTNAPISPQQRQHFMRIIADEKAKRDRLYRGDE